MAEEVNEEQAPAKKAEGKPKTRKIVTVAQGKARTCLKGIVTHGDEVTPGHFRGGKETFDRLKKEGVLVDFEVEVK
jgi:hypothetical protein